MNRETAGSLPSYSCASEAAGKPKCERWCGLPGKCISNMTPPTTGFATFTFVEREASGHTTQFDDWNAMKALLDASGISNLTSRYNYELSIDRSDLPRLTRRLERILRAISPYIDWSAPTNTLAASGAPAGAPTEGEQKEGQDLVHLAAPRTSVPDGVHRAEGGENAPGAGGSA